MDNHEGQPDVANVLRAMAKNPARAEGFYAACMQGVFNALSATRTTAPQGGTLLVFKPKP